MDNTDDKPIVKFDSDNFIGAFTGALNTLDEAENLGRRVATAGYRRIFLTGCGAPHYMMRSVSYWARKYAIGLDIRNYFSVELLHQDPAALDDKTLVVLGSHSGKTKETVEVAEFLSGKPCKTIAFTQFPGSQLAENVDDVIAYGDTKEGYFSAYILAQMFLSAFLNVIEPNWSLHSDIVDSLPHLPEALANAKQGNLIAAASQAKFFSEDRTMYVIGGGPMFTTAYTFASCFLMEMQRMHAHPIEAAEFFHGPFEVIDENTPIIILIGEGPAREEGQRVYKFCQKYAKRFIVMDSEVFQMRGIKPAIRPLVAPFVVDAALTALVESLAVVHDFPLTIRRYMGKVDY